MTTAIYSPSGFSLRAPRSLLINVLRAAWRWLHAVKRQPTARHRRSGRAHLEQLDERLRHDIGLSDSRPTPAEMLQRLQQSHELLAREHEIRLKPWSW
jgi:hypothetical protein